MISTELILLIIILIGVLIAIIMSSLAYSKTQSGGDDGFFDSREDGGVVEIETEVVPAYIPPVFNRFHNLTKTILSDPQIGTSKNYVRRLTTGASLEIGPGISPTLDPDNVDSKFLDVASVEGLDYTWVPGKTYQSVVGSAKFQNVVSSNNIEHEPCLITYLSNVYDILQNGGKFFVVVPHADRTLDYFRPKSSLGHIVATYLGPHEQPGLGSVLDQSFMNTNTSVERHLVGDHGSPNCVRDFESTKLNVSKFVQDLGNGEYPSDTNSWVFDEYSFTFIMEQLNKFGYTKFVIDRVHHPVHNSNEFVAILSKQ